MPPWAGRQAGAWLEAVDASSRHQNATHSEERQHQFPHLQDLVQHDFISSRVGGLELALRDGLCNRPDRFAYARLRLPCAQSVAPGPC